MQGGVLKMQLFNFKLTWFSLTYVVVSLLSLPSLFLQLNQPFPEAPDSPQHKTQMCHKALSVVFSVTYLSGSMCW